MLHLVNGPVWMNQNLCISVDPFIKLDICFWSIINLNLVGNNKARLCFPSYDHVAKISVVGFDVALACAKFQSLQTSALIRLGRVEFAHLFEELPERH
jgi:hypothetical protein